MKRIILIFLCVVFTLGVCACGTPDNANVIKVWCEADGSQKEVMDSFVEYFNANNNMGYTMKYEIKSSVTADLPSANSGRTAPDIIIWPRWETISKSKHIKDLSSKIQSSEVISLEDYNSKARSEMELGSKVYGVPVDLNAWGIWANMDLVGERELPQTWDELKAITRDLTSGSGANKVVGLDAYNLRGQFYTYMLTAGGQLVDSSGAIPKINIDSANKQSKSYKDASDVVSYFSELMDITGVPTDYHTNEYFVSNKVALKFGPSHFAKTLEILTGQQMNLKFLGYPAKSETEGRKSGMLGGFSLAVPASSNLDKSFKIIEWWLKDENLAKYCELYDILPAKTSLLNLPYIEQSQSLVTIRDLLEDYEVRPVVKGYPNVESAVLFDAMDKLRLKGFNSVDDCLNYIKTEGDKYFELESLM